MGNRVGWMIAIALVAVMAVVFVRFLAYPSPSAPTAATTREGAMSLVPFAADPEEITGRKREGSGNAGEYYHRAVELAQAAKGAIAEHFTHEPALAEGRESLSAEHAQTLDRIAQAVRTGAHQGTMRYVWEYTPKEFRIGPAGMVAQTDALELVLSAQKQYGRALAGGGKLDEAERVFQDTLVMGYHLVQERARAATVRKGLGIQQEACERLAELYATKMPQRQELLERVKNYARAIQKLRLAYDDRAAVLWRYAAIRDHPGDVINEARYEQDHAWRVEAIAGLGLVKYASGERGDRRWVNKLIQQYVHSADPLEAAAAAAAERLTRDEYVHLPNQTPVQE